MDLSLLYGRNNAGGTGSLYGLYGSGLYGAGGLLGAGSLYGLNGLYGAGNLYGLGGLYGNAWGQAASLYPAASYARFSEALQKATGEKLEETIEKMQKDPEYAKEALEMLWEVFRAQYAGGSSARGSGGGAGEYREGGTSGKSSAAVSDSQRKQIVERYRQGISNAQSYRQSVRGGSLAGRLAANRAGRLAARAKGRQEGAL